MVRLVRICRLINCLVESTNFRVLFFSVVSVLILVGLGVGQLWYLREFFASKKMI